MAIQTTIPLLGGKTDAKDLVITILSDSVPLNARELFFVARNKYGSKLSYQAIHKSLMKLFDEEVLIKQGKNYSLNNEWLEKIKEFAEKTTDGNKQSLQKIMENKKAPFLTFYSPIDALHCLLTATYQEVMRQKPAHVFGIMDRAWPVLCMEKKHFNEFAYCFENAKRYWLSQGESAGEKKMMEFVVGFGGKYKMGVKGIAKECDYVVVGNTVIKIFMPTLFRKLLGKYYDKTKVLDEKAVKKLYDIAYQTGGETRALIIDDKELAKKMTEKMLKALGERPSQKIS